MERMDGCGASLTSRLQAALDAVDGMAPVTYKYKNQPEEDKVGFIAEDVPDMVATKDRKGISAIDVTAVLTKVVQHLKSENDELKTRLEVLEKKLNK